MFEIFKDTNEWNEKSIVGFIAFAIMVLVMLADTVSGAIGKDLVINEFVYNSFVWVVLGSFGISGVEKFASNKKKNGI
tara:strand:+ start:428 stop:661 length:234 start_codon:yes stop_codon:yes gene_type:complete